MFSIPLNIPQELIAESYNFMFNFLGTVKCFPKWLYYSVFPPAMQEDSTFSTCLPALVIFFIIVIFDDVKSYFIIVSICISGDYVEHLFMFLLITGVSSLRHAYSNPLPIFKLDYLPFYCCVVSILYVFCRLDPYHKYNSLIFFPILFCGMSFHSIVFCEAKSIFILMTYNLFIYFFSCGLCFWYHI